MNDMRRRFAKPSLFYRPKAPGVQPPRRRHPVRRFLAVSLRRTCTVIGAIVLLAFLCGVIVAAKHETKAVSLPDQMVLYLKFNGDFPEYQKNDFAFNNDDNVPLRDIIDSLDVAAKDDRVKGLVAEWDSGFSDMAQLEELRNAILRFRKSGKFATIYGEDYADGLGAYYLASAFGEIWLQPMGMLSIPGIKAELPYARELMDKVGVTPDFMARGEYKSLFESFELKGMSPATQEATVSLLGDIGGTLLNAIAAGRDKKTADIRAAIDMGLLTDIEAQKMGFVDKVGYRDELLEGLRQKLVGDKDAEDRLPFYHLPLYAKAIRKQEDSKVAQAKYPHVALIYAVGEIAAGSAETAVAYGGGNRIAGDDLSAQIREAGRDPLIRTIVLRVNSPGGSPTASETIRRAVVYAQARGKKVYVSMGGAAASGGYWISTSADRIYASPLTLTGSIGVAGGKFVLQDLWKKIGVNWDSVTIGKNSGLQSFNQPYTEGERARMNVMFDRIYQGFVERVSQGRKMTLAQADKVARGRVWSGSQGKSLGLVDQLGGLDVVLSDVATNLGQPDRFHLTVDVLPKPKNPFLKLAEMLQGQVSMGLALKSQAALMERFGPVLENMAQPGPSAYEALRLGTK